MKHFSIKRNKVNNYNRNCLPYTDISVTGGLFCSTNVYMLSVMNVGRLKTGAGYVWLGGVEWVLTESEWVLS